MAARRSREDGRCGWNAAVWLSEEAEGCLHGLYVDVMFVLFVLFIPQVGAGQSQDRVQ